MASAPGVTTRDVAIGGGSFGDGFADALDDGGPAGASAVDETGGASAGDSSGCHAGWGSVVESAVALLSPLLAELDPDRLAGGDAVRLYASFVALDRLVLAGKTLLAPRIDASGVWQHRGHRNAASLLAEVEGVAPGQAQSLLEVGRRLGQLPGTQEAVRRGTLSGPKVVQLTGAGILDPARESDLLEGAAGEPLHRVRERCDRTKATARAHDPIATLRRIRAARFFSSWTDAEGAFCYQGKDTADRGAQILSQLGATASRLRTQRRHRRDEATDPERAVRADAFFALVTGVHPDGPVPAGGPGSTEASVGAGRRRSSGGARSSGSSGGARGPGPPEGSAALTALAGGLDPHGDPDLDPEGMADDHLDDHPDNGEAPGGHDSPFDQPSGDSLTIIDRPPTCTVMVRVDLDALVRGEAHEDELCEIDGHGPIPVPMARDMLNDSFLRLVFHRAGDIRSVHHFNRTINRTLRTALVFRDTTCVVPGCGAKTRLEIDHVVPVADHGPTTLDNLALLCHHHHFLKSNEGWTLERTGTDTAGRPVWRFEPEAPFGQEPDLGIDTPEARDRWRRAQE
jgi:HNH endonuclease